MRTPALTARLQPFTSTIFAEITELARRTGAVNLGQGFPDTDGPESMLRAAQEAIANGVNQYPPGAGDPELRAAISEQRAVDPSAARIIPPLELSNQDQDRGQAVLVHRAAEQRAAFDERQRRECARHLALRTDYGTKTFLPPEGEQPYPKDGLAVSPPRPIDRIEGLSPTATELNGLGNVLHEAFNSAETTTANRGRHPVNRRTRDQTMPAIEA